MLLGAVLVQLGGIGGCLIAALRWSGGRDLSPLFESSLAVAVVGTAMSAIAAAVEASRQASSLAGWLMLP